VSESSSPKIGASVSLGRPGGLNWRMPVEVVLLDMDGTVIEFTFDVLGARRSIIRVLRGNGVPIHMLSEDISTHQMLDLGCRYLEQLGVDCSAVLSQAYDELELLELRSTSNPSLTQGTAELLTFLRDKSVPTVLVTNSSEKAAMSVLSQLGIDRSFTEVVARQQGLRLKPHPDMILEGLSRLSMKPSRDAYLVGDSWMDMRAATLAGISGVGYNRNPAALPRLSAAGAVATFSSMREVENFFVRLLS